MLSRIPIVLEKVAKEDWDKEILRAAIIAELDAINLYEQMAGVIRDFLFFLNVKGVTVLDRTLAEKIDRKGKTFSVVHQETGESRVLPYDKLVLATGGTPIELPIEGKNLNHVFRLWQPEDALSMREFIQQKRPKKAVIVGGGLIGWRGKPNGFNPQVHSDLWGAKRELAR